MKFFKNILYESVQNIWSRLNWVMDNYYIIFFIIVQNVNSKLGIIILCIKLSMKCMSCIYFLHYLAIKKLENLKPHSVGRVETCKKQINMNSNLQVRFCHRLMAQLPWVQSESRDFWLEQTTEILKILFIT